MVLEVATGRKPITSVEDESAGSNVRLLADWVWDLYRDDVLLDAADITVCIPIPPLPRTKPVPTFTSNAFALVNGDTTATIYTGSTHHSNLTSWDQTSTLVDSDDQSASSVLSENDGDLSPPKTFAGWDDRAPILMLRLRRFSTTTSLPI
ncbi:unnamed protein product [Calypogeia fissa]